MTFTFSNVISPELMKSPLNDIIGNMLSGYGGMVNAKYLPQEKEANIFAKQLGPLATLSANPMFMQNPQFQAALGNMVSQFLGKHGHGFERVNFPTYSGQVQKDIQEAEHIAPELSEAGKAGVGVSGLAGTLESHFGKMGKYISDFFTHGKINPKLAHDENRFNDIVQTLKNNAIQTQRVTPQQAEKIFKVNKNETPQAALKRIKKEAPYLFENMQNSVEQSTPQKAKSGANYGPAPEGSIGLYKDGELFYIPEDKVNEALAEGFSYE